MATWLRNFPGKRTASSNESAWSWRLQRECGSMGVCVGGQKTCLSTRSSGNYFGWLGSQGSSV